MEDSEEIIKPMEKVTGENSSLSLRKSVWGLVKPFVNGGLAPMLQGGNAYFSACIIYRLYPTAKSSTQLHFRQLLYIYQRMPFMLFQRGINRATLFGSYELLTRKVEASNEGIPLTLYQEIGCGLASGAIGTYIFHPLIRPVGTGIAVHVTTDNTYYYFRHIFSNMRHVVRNKGILALWKGTSPTIPAAIASDAGMLVSYDRSRIYLKEAYGMREKDARLGAGIFSGLCSGACYIPILYATGIIDYIQSTRNESPKSFLFYALRVLKPGGGSNFYSRLAKDALFSAPGVMMMWVILEAIRDAEESIGL